MINKLKFPVLSFKNESHLEFYREPKDLTTGTNQGLRNGYYENLSIIDSSGKQYLIKNAEKATHNFWSIFSSKIEVRLLFDNSNLNELSLGEFKVYLQKIINNDRDFWESGMDIQELSSFIESCNDVKSIIEKLTKYYRIGEWN